ncbi:cyclic nucleotide-gated ion channel 1, partial [Quercus suber]
MRGTESTNKVKFLNAIVLFQYVPRVYQIYLSWRKLITTDKKFDRIILVLGAFCLLARSVDHNSGDLSFINDICPINVPYTTSTFDFGIFLLALQSGVLESPDFPQKLYFSFWWGMRNLSSLGENLQTSSYIWENCFALSISIFGLILFLYFLGNLQ